MTMCKAVSVWADPNAPTPSAGEAAEPAFLSRCFLVSALGGGEHTRF
jgi:hypothetical protein